jgi:methionyl-tRNA synthetase
MVEQEAGGCSCGIMDKFYITTPIYYVNDKPHIGHAYTTIVADTLARWRRGAGAEDGAADAAGEDVIFSTGTDEWAQKTVDAAAKAGEDVNVYLERMAGVWQDAWHRLGISNTDFIRTTEERHIEVVKDVWTRIEAAGDLYRGRYEGLYCKGHEAFLNPDELTPDGLCPEHKIAPEFVSEENYYFRLSKYQDELLTFYEANPDFVAPANRFNEVRAFVENGIEDVSFSRERRAGRADWGIPVPTDPTQVIYVWADALVNYISEVGIEGWEDHPADVQAVGKDILRFHAVIWPAMLLSAGLPLPGQIIANGFLTVGGTKMSKSLGNGVDPLDLVERYGGGDNGRGSDTLRYFLLREIPYGADGDFSEEKMRERYNGDLANGLGNFAARVLTLAEKEDSLKISKKGVDNEFKNVIDDMNRAVRAKLNEFKFNDALAAIWAAISFGDRYVNEKKIWEIKDAAVRGDALYNLVLLLDGVATALMPFLPDTAKKITTAIERDGDGLRGKKVEVLFPRKSFAGKD